MSPPFAYVGAAITWLAYSEACGVDEIGHIWQLWINEAQPKIIDHAIVEMIGRALALLTGMVTATVVGGYITGPGHIGPGYGYNLGEPVSKPALITGVVWEAGVLLLAFTCERYKLVADPTPLTATYVKMLAWLYQPLRAAGTDQQEREAMKKA